MKHSYQITEWIHHILRDHIEPGDICIDATAGNGNDTELLCELTGTTGKVYAFDIQPAALASTENRLSKSGGQAQLILDGHENMSAYIAEAGEISCIVFNLGYLPGGDHEKATKPDTSIKAIAAGLALLKPGGIISLCIYSGGDTGFSEKKAVMQYLKELDPKQYLVIVSEYYNRPNDPPVPVLVVRVS